MVKCGIIILMNTKDMELLKKVKQAAHAAPNSNRAWGLLIDVCEINTSVEHVPILKSITRHAASIISNQFPSPPNNKVTDAQLAAWRDNYWRAMRVLARVDFDAFLIYVERYRQPEKKFYGPRRKILYPIVQALNDMEMGDLRELILNSPARIGKTQIMTFFVIWVMGRDPDRTNIYSAYSGPVTAKFYDGVVEVLTDKDHYAYDEVFPTSPLVDKHADSTTIDMGRKKKYPSLTCRSIEASLNGVCDASGYIFADDLIEGTEEARSPARLQKKQFKVDNDLLRRETGGKLKIVWIGTPWSIHDPMSNRIKLLSTDPAFKDYKWKHIKMPGTDPETGESNFDYDYGVGFTTEQYARIKAGFLANDDLASWETQVQCNPMEYFGMLFPEAALTTYNGVLPPSEHERTIMFVDPAWGGSDYCAGPVCQIVRDPQGREIRAIPAVICSKEGKEKTIPHIVNIIKEYKVSHLYVEANKMTRSFAEEIQEELRAKHIKCAITTQPAPNNKAKEHRIWDSAQEIRQLWFIDRSSRTPEYNVFMNQVQSFNPEGNNPHDDAPDSLAGLVGIIETPHMPSVQTGRLWG